MKKVIIILIGLVTCLCGYSQRLKGTWLLGHKIINQRSIDIKETKIIVFKRDQYYITEIDLWGNIKPGNIKRINDFDNYEFTSPGTMMVFDHTTGTIEFWVKVEKLNKYIKKEIKNDKRRIKSRSRKGPRK